MLQRTQTNVNLMNFAIVVVVVAVADGYKNTTFQCTKCTIKLAYHGEI